MNHTPNYNLPQWELDDLIRMEDFNAAMASIETGIDGAKAEANTKYAELDRRVSAADVKADAAQSIANTALNRLPYVVGSYVGTGKQMNIQLGFRPSCVIISGINKHASNDWGAVTNFFGMTIGGNMKDKLLLTDSGFSIFPNPPTTQVAPTFTDKDRNFEYIAFR